MAEEVHGIQTEHGQFVGNSLNIEPASTFESMSLFLGDEFVPDIYICLQPLVWSSVEDVMGKEIVVAEGWYHRN